MTLIVVFGTFGFVFSVDDGSSHTSEERWVARVGEMFVLQSEFEYRYSTFLAATGARDNLLARDALLGNMIDEILLLQYDRSVGLDVNSRFRQSVNRSDERIVIAYLRDQEIYKQIVVTEAETRQAFSRVNEQIAVVVLSRQAFKLAVCRDDRDNLGAEYGLKGPYNLSYRFEQIIRCWCIGVPP